jgi:GT2 family glycosyltransferase
VCLNNDVEVNPQWLDHLVELASSDPSIGAIQPKLVSFFNERMFEYAGASGGMMDRFGFPFLRGRIFSELEEDKGQYDNVCEIFWASGAALFLRRSALAASGGLDNSIVHHMDEIDLCWRLRLHGYKVLVEPKSRVKHIGGATIRAHSFKKVYWNHRNSVYIMLKNYTARQVLLNTPVHLLLDYVAIIQACFTGNFITLRGILWAHIWLVINIPLILRKRKEVQHRRLLDDSAVLPFMYSGSIVYEHFMLKKNTFQSLTHKQLPHENGSHIRSAQWPESASTGSVRG